MDKVGVKEFLTGFEERYPAGLLEEYEPVECLGSKPECETLLLRRKADGGHFVAKCYSGGPGLGEIESGIHAELSHPGLPEFAGVYKEGERFCVVRRYAPGLPLDKRAAEKPFCEKEIISVGSQLCDILTYLHSRTPPVIHRDIKPQNIIIDENGKITLIDFGISRLYDKDSDTDTVFIGTREFAPPEQYGFAQTDARSDIFALGVLLRWMLTGRTDTAAKPRGKAGKRLLRVINKCAAFSPEGRFKNARKAKSALTGRTARFRIAAALGLTAVLAFAAVFTAPLLFKEKPVLLEKSFSEPLIEKAALVSIGSDAERLTEDKFKLVTNIYIFGDIPVANGVELLEIYTAFEAGIGVNGRGTISTLKDLAKFPNLRTVSILYQNIRDLSPLAGLTRLHTVDLRYNPITDVSPLASLDKLGTLRLSNCKVSDLNAISACQNLVRLDIDGTNINSVNTFNKLKGLVWLALRNTPIKSLEGISSMTKLETLIVSNTQIKDFTQLLTLPSLEAVYVNWDMQDYIRKIKSQASFQVYID